MQIDLYIGTSAIKDHAVDSRDRTICRSTAHIVARTPMNELNAGLVTCVKCRQKLRKLGISLELPTPALKGKEGR
jgi:hypothetical protein